MRDPLSKRYPRELAHNAGKYVGLFLMMVLAVAFTSGFLTAARSISWIIRGMDETYRIEDGHFCCNFEPSAPALAEVETVGVDVVSDPYKEAALSLAGEGATDIKVRLFCVRETVNLAAYAAGRAPASSREIAVDRVFCENHGLELGDVVTVAGQPFTLVGIETLPDHQALFEDNAAFMFNALTFAVGEVTEAGYESLGDVHEVFRYDYVFRDDKLDVSERTERERELVQTLGRRGVVVSELIDAQDNQGIGYPLDDVEGDATMWSVLLALLVVIMGFVFVVLTSSTIEQESQVIGTLLANGWRKRELIRHYLLLPAVIGLVAATLGLGIGLGVLKGPMKDLYYHSYSLPPYETHLTIDVIFVTGILPPLTLTVITFLGLMRALRFSPLQFLRHDTTNRRRGSRLVLPAGIRYVTRFRLRVLARNASGFVTLFLGILFASLLLLFGLCLLPVVDNYAQALRRTVAAPHQYVLKVPLELTGSEEELERARALLRVANDGERARANRDALDALERLGEVEGLTDALDRLEDVPGLLDALEVLDENERLSSALGRLEQDEDLMEVATRLAGRSDLLDAAEHLVEEPSRAAAALSLRGQRGHIELLRRLEAMPEVVSAHVRLSAHPLLSLVAARLARGSVSQADDLLLSLCDDRTLADVYLLAGLDEATRADLAVAGGLASTVGIDLLSLLVDDRAAYDDLLLVAEADEQTRQDLQTLARVDEGTRSDFDVVSGADERTRAAMELLDGLEGQQRVDLEFLQGLDDETRRDVELVRDMDEGLRADLEVAADFDDEDHLVNTRHNDAEVLADVERYAVTSVEVERAFGGQMEDVTVMGIDLDSAFWRDVPVADGHAVCGQGLIEKTKAERGEVLTMGDERSGEVMKVRIAEALPNEADTTLYLSRRDFNLLFSHEPDYFNAYASTRELALDSRYVASHVRPEDMDDLSAQMRESMGDVMGMTMAMSVPIYLILVYLLTKTVIDRSARSISYMKVFGYRTHEVDGLYIRPITAAVLASLVVSIPVIVILMSALLKIVFMSYAGNFPLDIPPDRLVLLVVCGMACYAVVAVLHVRRIHAVPLSLALKVQE